MQVCVDVGLYIVHVCAGRPEHRPGHLDREVCMRAYVSLRCFTISSMYIVERVKLSELPCDIPSLRHSLLLFVCLHLSSLGRDRTSTFCHRFFHRSTIKDGD